MSPSQIDFLHHILDECNYLAEEQSKISFEEFKSNRRILYAISRSLEIIGEATRNVEKSIKQQYAFVDWRELSDMRNRLIHHYFGIDYDIIWNTIVTDIPLLKQQIETIIAQESSNDKQS